MTKPDTSARPALPPAPGFAREDELLSTVVAALCAERMPPKHIDAGRATTVASYVLEDRSWTRDQVRRYVLDLDRAYRILIAHAEDALHALHAGHVPRPDGFSSLDQALRVLATHPSALHALVDTSVNADSRL